VADFENGLKPKDQFVPTKRVNPLLSLIEGERQQTSPEAAPTVNPLASIKPTPAPAEPQSPASGLAGGVADFSKGLAGGVFETGGMIGDTATFASRGLAGRKDAEAGKGLADASRRTAEKLGLVQSEEGKKAAEDPFSVRGAAFSAGQMVAPSIAMPLAFAAAGRKIAGIKGAAIGGLLGFGASIATFFGNQAKSTYDKVFEAKKRAGLDDEAAHDEAIAAGVKTGAIEAAGETAADYLTFKLFRLLPSGVKENVVRAATKAIRNPWEMAKDIAINTSGQVGTEIAQAAGQQAVEANAGAEEAPSWDSVKGVIVPAAIMSIFMFGGGEMVGSMRRRDASKALSDPETPVEKRREAMFAVANEVAKHDPALAERFIQDANTSINQGKPVIPDEDEVYAEEKRMVARQEARIRARASKDSRKRVASIPDEKLYDALVSENDRLEKAMQSGDEHGIAMASEAIALINGRLDKAEAAGKPISQSVDDLSRDIGAQVDEALSSPDVLQRQSQENESAEGSAEPTAQRSKDIENKDVEASSKAEPEVQNDSEDTTGLSGEKPQREESVQAKPDESGSNQEAKAGGNVQEGVEEGGTSPAAQEESKVKSAEEKTVDDLADLLGINDKTRKKGRKPEKNKTAKPETPEQPEQPEAAKPETPEQPEAAKPETPEQPETPEVAKPETPGVAIDAEALAEKEAEYKRLADIRYRLKTKELDTKSALKEAGVKRRAHLDQRISELADEISALKRGEGAQEKKTQEPEPSKRAKPHGDEAAKRAEKARESGGDAIDVLTSLLEGDTGGKTGPHHPPKKVTRPKKEEKKTTTSSETSDEKKSPEQLAAEVGESKKKLRKRFEEHLATLDKEVRKAFDIDKPRALSVKNKTLTSTDGKYKLVWRVRKNPEAEISPDNEQREDGYVELVTKEKKKKQSKAELEQSRRLKLIGMGADVRRYMGRKVRIEGSPEVVVKQLVKMTLRKSNWIIKKTDSNTFGQERYLTMLRDEMLPTWQEWYGFTLGASRRRWGTKPLDAIIQKASTPEGMDEVRNSAADYMSVLTQLEGAVSNAGNVYEARKALIEALFFRPEQLEDEDAAKKAERLHEWLEDPEASIYETSAISSTDIATGLGKKVLEYVDGPRKYNDAKQYVAWWLRKKTADDYAKSEHAEYKKKKNFATTKRVKLSDIHRSEDLPDYWLMDGMDKLDATPPEEDIEIAKKLAGLGESSAKDGEYGALLAKFKGSELERAIVKKFGLAGIGYGQYVNREEQALFLRHLYNSLHDYAEMNGIPTEAVGQGGKLRIAYGARGHGRFAAHYEPGTRIINLTKDKGDGSLLHEHSHSLENGHGLTGPAADKAMSDMYTILKTSFNDEKMDEVLEEILAGKRYTPRRRGRKEQLLNAAKSFLKGEWKDADYGVISETDFFANAKSLGEYWSRAAELWARANEARGAIKLGDSSPFLVGSHANMNSPDGWREENGYIGSPYPTGEEAEAFSQAIDYLWHNVETVENEDGSVSLVINKYESLIDAKMDQLQERADKLLEKLSEMYDALNAPKSKDGLHWYRFTFGSRGKNMQPNGYYAFDDAENTVGYARILEQNELDMFGLEGITFEATDKTVYLKEVFDEGNGEGALEKVSPEHGGAHGEERDSESGSGNGDRQGGPGEGEAGVGGSGKSESAGKGGGNGVDTARSEQHVSDAAGGRGGAETAEKSRPAGRDYRLTGSDTTLHADKDAEFKASIAAVRALMALDGRKATAEEQADIAPYSGFYNTVNDYYFRYADSVQRAMLESTLPQEMFEELRRQQNGWQFIPAEMLLAIYDSLETMGFEGGKVAHINTGAGRSAGMMPEGMRKNSSNVIIERTTLDRMVAKALYQKSKVMDKGLAETNLARGFFDGVIINAIGGEEYAKDTAFNKTGMSTWTYAFSKALSATAEGGVVVGITDSGMLGDDTAKSTLARSGELIAGIRLSPQKGFDDGFHRFDILFFKATKNPTGTYLTDKRDYFEEHPEMVIGSPVPHSLIIERRHGETPSDAARKMPAGALKKEEVKFERPDPYENILDENEVFEGSFTEKDGKLYQRLEGKDVEVSVSGAKEKLIKDMIGLRGILRSYYRKAFSGEDSEAERKKLNKAYDAFVKKHGALSSPKNIAALDSDPDYPRLMAIENYDFIEDKAEKTEVFFKAPSLVNGTPDHVDSAKEALKWSLNDIGHIDFDYMRKLTGKTPQQLQLELAGEIYNSPETGWETKEEYLSGNIAYKLEVAKAAAEVQPDVFGINVKALELAMPTPLRPEEIKAKLGASWIPDDIVNDFISYIAPFSSISVRGNRITGMWKLGSRYASSKSAEKRIIRDEKQSTVATAEWGTSYKNGDFFSLLLTTLNGGVARVPKDPAGTRAVQVAQERIKAEFETWAMADEERAKKLADIYNKTFNSYVEPEYSAEHLTFHGMSRFIELRKHQKRAVWRSVVDDNVYFAHEVGTGKTYTMIASAMENKRLGKVKKPVIAGLNANIDIIRRDIFRLYPTARVDFIFVPTDTQGIQKAIRKIQASNADIIVMNHGSLSRLSVSGTYKVSMLMQEKARLEDALGAERFGGSDDIRNSITRAIKNLEEQIEEAKNEAFGNPLSFEDTGIDMVLIDEAHEFRKLSGKSALESRGVKGIDMKGPESSTRVFEQTQYLADNGGKVVFASGTPIVNSVTELHSISRYLQPDRLRALNIYNFDQWASTFGNIGTTIEYRPEGGGYEEIVMFKGFDNVPEMVGIVREVMDTVTSEQMVAEAKKAGEKISIPGVKGGEPKVVVVPQTPELEKYTKETLIPMVRTIKESPKEAAARGFNMLKVTTDSRKAALDTRLVDSSLIPSGETKASMAAKNALKEWEASKDIKGTQLFFLDTSIPAKDRFNVYQEIKDKLMEGGVPEKEIAFIHDYGNERKRMRLFHDVNKGSVRFLIGSTEKMGTGTNVQERVVAVHHIDIRFNIAAYIQRNGRAYRQGNINSDVSLYVYVTEKSADVFMWDKVALKAKAFSALFTGDRNIRSTEDVSSTESMDAGEFTAIASGNPLIKERSELEREISSLKAEKRSFNLSIKSLKAKRAERLAFEEAYGKRKEAGEEELALWESIEAFSGKEDEERFKIGSKAITEYVDAAIKEFEKSEPKKGDSTELGYLSGEKGNVSLALHFNGESTVVTGSAFQGTSVGRLIANAKAKLTSALESLDSEKEENDRELKAIDEALKKTFPKEEELSAKEKRLAEVEASLAGEEDDGVLRSRALFNAPPADSEPMLFGGVSSFNKVKPTAAAGGTDYIISKDKLQELVDRHGDGYIYRVTLPEYISDGIDTPAYSHQYKSGDVNKTLSFTTNLENAIAYVADRSRMDGRPTGDYIIYRVRPESLGSKPLRLIVPTERGDTLTAHIHSVEPVNVADIVMSGTELANAADRVHNDYIGDEYDSIEQISAALAELGVEGVEAQGYAGIAGEHTVEGGQGEGREGFGRISPQDRPSVGPVRSRGSIRPSASSTEEALSEVVRIVGDAATPTAVDKLPGDTQGQFRVAERLIEIAKNIDDPKQIAWHESFHALQRLVFNSKQIAVLNKAFSTGKPLRRRIERLMREQGFHDVLKSGKDFNNEEAQAYAFQAYMSGNFAPRGIIRAMFAKLRRIVEAIGNAIRGRGLQTAEGIFERAGRGEYAKGFERLETDKNVIAHSRSKEKFPGDYGIETARFPKVAVPVSLLKELTLPGGKKAGQFPPKRKALEKSVAERGYDTNSIIDIIVGADGVAKVRDGGHRIALADAHGIEKLPARVTYYDGAEDVAGEFSPSNLVKGLYRSADDVHEELSRARASFGYEMRQALIEAFKRSHNYTEHKHPKEAIDAARDTFTERLVTSNGAPESMGIETASFTKVTVSTRHIAGLMGYRSGSLNLDGNKVQAMTRDMSLNGYDFDEPIEIGVNQNGEAFLVDGAHRLVAALRAGYSAIPANIRYFNGGEKQPGPFYPDDLAMRGSGADEFDVQRSRGDFAAYSDKELDAYASAMKKIGRKAEKKPLKERLSEVAGARARLAWTVTFVDRFNAMYDYELRRFMEENPGKGRKDFAMHDSKAYMSMRMAVHSGKVAEAWLTIGQMKWKRDSNGEITVPELIEGKRALFDIIGDLHDDADSFLHWMVGMRAKRLMEEGREGQVDEEGNALNLFTPEEIDALINQAPPEKLDKFKAVLDELNEYDRNKLQFLKDAGGLSESGMEAMLKYGDYIPFYRIIEDAIAGPGKTKPLQQGNGIYRLHGGRLNIGSLIENMYMNTNVIIDAAFKAKAFKRADEAFRLPDGKYDTSVWEPRGLVIKKGLATAGSALDSMQNHDVLAEMALREDFDMEAIPKTARNELLEVMAAMVPSDSTTISFIKDGKRVYRRVNDPLILRAFNGLSHKKSKAPEWAKAPKQLLTRLVTVDPAFGIANSIRDALSVAATTDVKLNVGDVLKGWSASFKNDERYKRAWISGALPTVGYLHGADEAQLQAHIHRLKELKVGDGRVGATLASLTEMVDRWSGHFENAARLGVFTSAIESGKYTDEQAAFLALDTLDFGMHGDGDAALFLIDTVPFMNARIQGLYRLGRGFIEHPDAVLKVGGAIMAASMLLALVNGDDDRYKRLPEYDKDTYWHIWIGGYQLRIPKPFEVGAITGTLPERLIELIRTGDLDLFADRVFFALENTFNLNPVPQVAKPIIEEFANKSFFTGRPIVPIGQQHVERELQFSPWTSPTMRELAQVTKYLPENAITEPLQSPKRMEHMFKGYFGTVGGYVLSGLDYAVRLGFGYPERPEGKIEDVMVLGRFVRSEFSRNTKYTAALYDMYDAITEVNSTLKQYRHDGDFEAARAYREKKAEIIKASPRIRAAMSQIRRLNRQMKRLYENPGRLSSEELGRRVDDINNKINSIAEKVYPLHTHF